MTTIIDYGVGNLFSLCSSLAYLGKDAAVTSDEAVIRASDRLILPGVGAFGDAARKLRATGLNTVIKEEAAAGKPLLGICLGMQLLYEKSYEYGEHEGLGLLKGSIIPIRELTGDGYKIPHIGWNALKIKKRSVIFENVKDGDHVYFVHSYCASGDDEDVLAYTEYGADIVAASGHENVFGCQFHPEKSGEVGLGILKAFTEL